LRIIFYSKHGRAKKKRVESPMADNWRWPITGKVKPEGALDEYASTSSLSTSRSSFFEELGSELGGNEKVQKDIIIKYFKGNLGQEVTQDFEHLAAEAEKIE
jgi:hypothetical protein